MSEATPKLQFVAAVDAPRNTAAVRTEFGTDDHALEEAVAYVLADCSFAVGQTVGMRTTVDYEAIVWWHNHFRTKFLAAVRRPWRPVAAGPGECNRGRVDAGGTRGAPCGRPRIQSTLMRLVVPPLTSNGTAKRARSGRSGPLSTTLRPIPGSPDTGVFAGDGSATGRRAGCTAVDARNELLPSRPRAARRFDRSSLRFVCLQPFFDTIHTRRSALDPIVHAGVEDRLRAESVHTGTAQTCSSSTAWRVVGGRVENLSAGGVEGAGESRAGFVKR